MAETKVIISAEDRTAAGISSVKSSMDGLGVAAQAWSGVLKGAFAGLAGALSVDALKGWVKGSIDAADSMNDLSQRIGISVRDLGTWSLAAAQSGTSMTAVAMSVKSLSGFMAKHSEELVKAGITATDANGAMVQLADLFAAMPDGVEKTALATRLFGRSGAELIPILNGGSAALEAAKQKAAGYAAELEKLGPRADEFNDLLAEIELQSKATGLAFANHLIGPLTEVVKFLKDAREGADGFHSSMLRLQTLTNSGPLSIFGVAADISERGGVAHRAAALAGMGGDEEKRGASGLIPGGAGDIAAKLREEEKLGEKNLAGMRARMLQNKQSEVGESTEKTPLQKMLALASARQAAMIDSGEGGLSVATVAGQYAAKEASDLEKLSKKYVEMVDPLQKYRDELDQINMLRANGKLTADQALKAEWQVGEAMKENSTFAHDMGMSFSSAFEDAALSGKKLSDVIQGLGKDIARIIMRKSITEPLGDAVSGAIKGSDIGSSIGGWFKGLFNAQGNAFASGDLARYTNSIVTRPTLFKFAHGVGLMGEKPGSPGEAIMPLSRMSGGDLGVKVQGGGGVSNHFTVDMRGASVEAVARLERLVTSVNGSIERRAMSVMSQARVRGA